MNNRVFSDYGKIDLSTLEGRKNFVGAMTSFMQFPHRVGEEYLKLNRSQLMGISALSVTPDMDPELLIIMDRIILGLTADIDVGYLKFFQVRDFQNTNVPGFEVRDVTSSLSFEKRPEGGRAHIFELSGTKTMVAFDTYGGGMQLDQAWFQDEQWWLIEDAAADFRNAYYRDKATIFYTLIGAIGAGNDEAYSAVGSTTYEKDINTINNAVSAMVTRLVAAGYAVGPGTTFVLLSPVALMGRSKRVILGSQASINSNVTLTTLDFNIDLVVSGNVLNAKAACTDKWYLGCPGLKSKLGEKMPLTVFSNFNAAAFAQTMIGWGRYGAVLNSTQVTRISSA